MDTPSGDKHPKVLYSCLLAVSAARLHVGSFSPPERSAQEAQTVCVAREMSAHPEEVHAVAGRLLGEGALVTELGTEDVREGLLRLLGLGDGDRPVEVVDELDHHALQDGGLHHLGGRVEDVLVEDERDLGLGLDPAQVDARRRADGGHALSGCAVVVLADGLDDAGDHGRVGCRRDRVLETVDGTRVELALGLDADGDLVGTETGLAGEVHCIAFSCLCRGWQLAMS